MILTILIAVFAQNSDAQKMPSDYFDEGNKYFEDSNYKNAIISFKYIVNHYPKNVLYPRAFYNLGYIYYCNNQYDSSLVIFKNILVSQFNEKEHLGGDIMADPYTNYRHWACIVLCNIYEDKSMFDTALHYLALGDTVYRYLHFCGNELDASKVSTALKYAELYKKLNKKDEAIQHLLPVVFKKDGDCAEVLAELKELLKEKKNVKKELDLALAKPYSKPYRENTSERYYFFKFLNTEIAFPGRYESDEYKFDRKRAIEDVHKWKFYQMIEGL